MHNNNNSKYICNISYYIINIKQHSYNSVYEESVAEPTAIIDRSSLIGAIHHFDGPNVWGVLHKYTVKSLVASKTVNLQK